MRKYIRKADIILFIFLVAAGLAATAVIAVTGTGTGGTVVIESNGDLYASYSLYEDRTIVVPAPGAKKTGKSDDQAGSDRAGYDRYNIVEISDGKVSVTDSSCKNQVCVRHGAISGSGESIICLPNRLVVRIEGSSGGEEGGGYDAITS